MDIREVIDKKIEEKFSIIEIKIKNSFKDLKKDNDEKRKLLKKITGDFKNFSEERVILSVFNKEISKIQEEIKILKKNLDKDLEEKQLLNSRRIESMERKISDRDIKYKVKKLVLEDIKENLQKLTKNQKEELKNESKENSIRISKDLDKYTDKADYLKKEFSMFKNEFVILRENLDKWKIDIAKELKSLIFEKEEINLDNIQDIKNQINSIKARNTILTKEINSFQVNEPKKLLEEIKEDKKKEKWVDKLINSLSD
jgi:hypothetical protein